MKLRREQKIGLVGVFSLGAITLSVSLARFIAYNVTDFGLDDASGSMYSPSLLTYPSIFLENHRLCHKLHVLTRSTDTLCTAEMTTAVIVVCLPGLKKFITRSKASTNTTDRGDGSQSGSGQISSNHAFKSRSTPQAYAEWGVRDDEIELVAIAKKSHFPSTEIPDGRDTAV